MLQTEGKLLRTLERLIAIPSTDVGVTLSLASDLVASALAADKVDAFLHDPSRESLVAAGSSTQALSGLQRKMGLDVLPIANGGRAVEVFRSGVSYLNGEVDKDDQELLGMKDALGVRSQVGVPLDIAGRRRGMVMIASQKPQHFDEQDLRLAESLAVWIGLLAHRAELAEEIARNAVEQGRRALAEELMTELAHDLRNLLAPLESRLGMIQQRAEQDERALDIRDSDAAMKSLTRLRAMIDDILDVARIEQGLDMVQRQKVDLGVLVKDVVSFFQTPQHTMIVHSSGDVFAFVDARRIRQLLENVIANAVKHSPRGGTITILIEREARYVRVEVIDQGPGVPLHMRSTLFDRFTTDAPAKGLGLGLYLAKRIASMHDGDLKVESGAGRGARFILCLPAA